MKYEVTVLVSKENLVGIIECATRLGDEITVKPKLDYDERLDRLNSMSPIQMREQGMN